MQFQLHRQAALQPWNNWGYVKQALFEIYKKSLGGVECPANIDS